MVFEPVRGWRHRGVVASPTVLTAIAASVALGLLVACAPAAAPSAPPAALPAAAQAPAAATAAWDQVLAAAKREGKVVITGGLGFDSQEGLVRPFQAQYPDIQVEYNGMRGAEAAPKLIAEQQAGRPLTDLILTGTTTITRTLKSAGVLEPIPPLLTGPHGRDLQAWRGAALSYADLEGQYNLVLANYVKVPFVVNPELTDPQQFTTWRDLLDPKWRGKIAMITPLQAGSGQSIVQHWYVTEGLGKDFIRQLFQQQQVVLARDDRQVLEWIGRGNYLIGLGVSDNQWQDYVRKGLPLRPIRGEALKEQPYVTAGTASLGVLRDPPHPNAVRVYLDFLLSREGQTAFSRAIGYASLRQDVPTEHVLEALVLQPNVTYWEQHLEKYHYLEEETVEFLKTVLPS
jgi:iron(III) transport system substrate-binding protein